MKLDEAGILVYSNLKRNPVLYSDIGDSVIFSFDQGAKVEFYSKNPKTICKIFMIEKYSGIIHYNAEITNNMFARSNRKEISPLTIVAFNESDDMILEIDLEEWAKNNQ